MTDIFEDFAGEESPVVMRLNGSGASSASVASRLYNGRSSSRRDSGSFGSEPELISFSDNEIHSEITDISSQVTSISKRLVEMEENQSVSNDERNRLKLENALLTERIHVLEEQLQVTEQRYKDRLNEESIRNRDLIKRTEREKELEIESAKLKYEVIQRDFSQLKREKEKLADECSNLRETLEGLRDELNMTHLLCEDLEEERAKLDKEYRRFKEEAQHDMDSSSEMVEELSRQTEELRARTGVPRQGSMADQIVSLEDELERVRAETRELRQQNEDMHAQMLQDSVERGRSLLEDGAGLSLADELNGKDTTELVNALREQEVCNQKLRVYINGILMRVIERHPEILEIKETMES